MKYPVGKLPQADLLELLGRNIPALDPRVILGPGLGRDAAVIELSDRYLVVKTDPITFATDEIGWYVVNVNANDIACLGARPLWFIATVLLPEGKATRTMVERIFDDLHSACSSLGVSIVGGHTEITYGIQRPIVVGAMLGEVSRQALVRSDGARPGDSLIITKGAAIEGTAILAKEFPQRLSTCVCPELLSSAMRFLHNPGISVVKDAGIVAGTGYAHAMHDPTEGGISTGIYEITESAGVGAVIDESSLPLYPETRAVCNYLGLNPLGVIASGALLAAIDPLHVKAVIDALGEGGIPATEIGSIRAEPGVIIRDDRGEHPLPRFARDEIARLFE